MKLDRFGFFVPPQLSNSISGSELSGERTAIMTSSGVGFRGPPKPTTEANQPSCHTQYISTMIEAARRYVRKRSVARSQSCRPPPPCDAVCCNVRRGLFRLWGESIVAPWGRAPMVKDDGCTLQCVKCVRLAGLYVRVCCPCVCWKKQQNLEWLDRTPTTHHPARFNYVLWRRRISCGRAYGGEHNAQRRYASVIERMWNARESST